jgi:hypothetical protein
MRHDIAELKLFDQAIGTCCNAVCDWVVRALFDRLGPTTASYR